MEGRRVDRRIRRVAMFVAAVFLVGCAWELYKLVGPADGGKVLGMPLLPRSSDRAMPHTWNMLRAFGDPEGSASDRQNWQAVLSALWYSFRLVICGFALGVVVGLGLAIVMTRLKVIERGLLPWLVASQTVPLIALAPLVVSWGGKLQLGPIEWQKWMSAVVLGGFLSFFPVSIGTLKGLTSPGAQALELMQSYAATWRQTLFKLRFPAAMPYITPALKLAASASVFGVLVSEMSTGVRGGVGRLIIQFASEATAKPARLFTAVFGAIALGLIMSGLVAAADQYVMRNRPKEATS